MGVAYKAIWEVKIILTILITFMFYTFIIFTS